MSPRKSTSLLILFCQLGLGSWVAAAWAETPPLLPGTPLERTLSAGQCEVFDLPRGGGPWLVSAAQLGIDLAIQPILDGERQPKLDRPSARRGVETLYLELPNTRNAAVEICGGNAGPYRLSLADLRARPTEERAAWADDSLAAQALSAGDRARAAALWLATADRWKKLGRLQEEADASTWAAFSYRAQDPSLALQLFARAQILWQSLKNPYDEARVVNEIGFLNGSNGRLELAIASYRQALELWKQAADRGGEARTLNNLGLAWHQLGQPREAQGFYEAALVIFHELGDLGREATALSNLAAVATDLGEAEKAKHWHLEALRHFRDLGNPREEARVLGNLAQLERQLGHFQTSLELTEQAVALRRHEGNATELASTLSNLGQLYLEIGDATAARRALEEALELDRGAGADRSTAFIWHNLGKAAQLEGGTVAALSSFGRALELHRQRGDRRAEAESSLALADVLIEQQRWVDAGQVLATAQQLAAQIAVPPLSLAVEARLEELALRSGDCAAASRAAKASMAIAQQIGGKDAEAQGLLANSRFARQCGDLNAAARDSQAALALLEAQRADLVDLELRASFLAERRRAFEVAIDTLLDQRAQRPEADFGERALELMERARARYFLDRFEQDAPSEDFAPITASAIQQLLDRETTLLIYWLGASRGALFAVSSRGMQVFELPARAELARRVRAVTAAWRVLESGRPSQPDAAGLAEILLPPTLRADFARPGQRLALILDGPLHSLPFAALPTTPGRVVVDDHELVVVASASVLAAQRRRSQAKSVPSQGIAAFADPIFSLRDERVQRASRDGNTETGKAETGKAETGNAAPMRAEEGSRFARLPQTSQEAASLGRWAAVAGERWQLAVGGEASAEALRALVGKKWRVVHFASHAQVEPNEPARSALILAQFDETGRRLAGQLDLEALRRSRLEAELVVLSACGTALGRELVGEGLIGLARAFQVGGARRVLASLWSIDDRATVQLMDYFYQSHLGERQSAVKALADAQRQLRTRREFQDPFFWAPFIVVGDWR